MRHLHLASCLAFVVLAAACGPALKPEPAPTSTTLRLTNRTATDLFYYDGFWHGLELDGKAVPIGDSCLNLCANDQCVGCPAIAFAPNVVELAAGVSVDYVWDGRFFATDDTMNSCGKCYQLSKVTDRDFTFRASYGTQMVNPNELSGHLNATKTFRVGVDALVEIEAK